MASTDLYYSDPAAYEQAQRDAAAANIQREREAAVAESRAQWNPNTAAARGQLGEVTAAIQGAAADQYGYNPNAGAFSLGMAPGGGGSRYGHRVGGMQDARAPAQSIQDYLFRQGQMSPQFQQNLELLQALAQGRGESPAQMQLQQGLQNIQAGLQSQAAGVRGGNAGANLRALANAQAQAQGQFNDQQALLRAQEMAQWQQALAQGYGQQQQNAQAFGSLGLNAATENAKMQQQLQQALMERELAYDKMRGDAAGEGYNTALQGEYGLKNVAAQGAEQRQTSEENFVRDITRQALGAAATGGATVATSYAMKK